MLFEIAFPAGVAGGAGREAGAGVFVAGGVSWLDAMLRGGMSPAVESGCSCSRGPGWMVYGGGMLFHAARSSVLMPLLVAIRYRLSPRRTTVVAPYLGVEPPVAGMRVTVLLAQAASTASASVAET